MPKYTKEFKQQVIELAAQVGFFKASQTHGLYPDTVKYWTDSAHRAKAKQGAKNTHSTKKDDEEYKQKRSEYAEVNKEQIKAKRQEWVEENKESITKVVKQHRLDNIEHYRKLAKNNYEANKSHYRALGKKDYEENKSKYLKITKYNYHNKPIHKLKHLIRTNLNRALDGTVFSKTMHSIEYLGCTVEEFKVFIESKFKEGMTWDNHTRGEHGWHLDHIKPLSLLKSVDDVDTLKELCHYTNYQPLWEKENLSKSNKLI